MLQKVKKNSAKQCTTDNVDALRICMWKGSTNWYSTWLSFYKMQSAKEVLTSAHAPLSMAHVRGAPIALGTLFVFLFFKWNKRECLSNNFVKQLPRRTDFCANEFAASLCLSYVCENEWFCLNASTGLHSSFLSTSLECLETARSLDCPFLLHIDSAFETIVVKIRAPYSVRRTGGPVSQPLSHFIHA